MQTVRDNEIAKRRRSVEVMMAEKEAEEIKIAAAAQKVRSAVEAEARRLLNEAENVLTDEARYSLFRRKLLEHVEGIRFNRRDDATERMKRMSLTCSRRSLGMSS